LPLAQQNPGAERDSVDQRLAAELRQMEAVIAAMADGLVLYAPDGKIQRINPAAEGLLGLSSEPADVPIEQRLRGLSVLTTDGKPVAAEQHPTARALRGEAVSHEVLILEGPPPHGRRSVSVSAIPIRGADDKVDAVVATLVDVTRLQQLQEQRDDLLRRVSHDLGTPLSALLLQTQMLQRSLTPGDPHVKRVATIIANGQRLATMIRDLVDSARLESGRIQLARKPINVQTFITELVERLAETLPTERIRLSFQARLPSLPADPDRLERILVNLLSNALKYSNPPAEVFLHASCADGFVSMAVTDHGVGIPRQELPHLFERFSRSRDGSQQQALGLGLYITAMLVRAHGGRIEVESELGQGSIFRIHLPVDGGVAAPVR
jgi:two-component system, OmpR family, phosphate regulon sensor histidine kinase PhoR